MHNYRFLNKYNFLLLFAFIFAVLLPEYLNAYVLHGRHIISLMIKNFNKLDSLMISQNMTIYPAEKDESPIQLNSTLRYRFPEYFRSDTKDANREKFYIFSKGDILKVVDGKITEESENIFDFYKDIILYNTRHKLENRLSELGLNISVSSIGHLNGKIAFIIGAQYPDLSVPQLWVDKQNFIPCRLILTDNVFQENETVLDIRYLDWTESGKVKYPMRTEFYQNSMLVRVITVESIKADPLFLKDIFNIHRIRTQLKSNIFNLPAPKNRSINVPESFEELKRIYR